MTSRTEPTLAPPGPAVLRAQRTAPAPPAPRRERRHGWSVGRWLLAILLLGAALVFLPVVALRWLPPPTTAFMLMSPVKPVRYTWVPDAKIAAAAKRAVVAAEDQKFWVHDGFDFEAIEKAIAHNQKSRKRRGASTISQQTAKNLFLWSGGGYFRKGLEAGYTVLIETLWSKQRILEVYLNVAEFGPGIYGVEAAAQAYFGRSAAQLSSSQAARLAAVLPSPRRWSAASPGPYVQRRTSWILGQIGGSVLSAPAEEPEPPQVAGDPEAWTEAEAVDEAMPPSPEAPPAGEPAVAAELPAPAAEAEPASAYDAPVAEPVPIDADTPPPDGATPEPLPPPAEAAPDPVAAPP